MGKSQRAGVHQGCAESLRPVDRGRNSQGGSDRREERCLGEYHRYDSAPPRSQGGTYCYLLAPPRYPYQQQIRYVDASDHQHQDGTGEHGADSIGEFRPDVFLMERGRPSYDTGVGLWELPFQSQRDGRELCLHLLERDVVLQSPEDV